MKLISFFLPQGFAIAELITETEKVLHVKNPCLIVMRGEKLVLAPFLEVVEEKDIIISKNDLSFQRYFTPKVDLINAYNSIYGAGLTLVT